MRRNILVSMTIVGLLAFIASSGWVGASDDHDRARQALERGEIMSLRAVLDRVEAEYPGEIIEVELEREEGQWRYEVKLLRAGGAMIELDIDAHDGTVLGMKGRDPGRHERHR
ncbi:MAG TPA: PepSY domain-containing protein [Rhodocyclaceae bacterium]|nr:PepSY domain-containing protein [Rhodocyclaceae bacterium]